MASKRSRNQRGESSSAAQPANNPDLQLPGWEEVVIVSEEQRVRMINRIDRQVISTRFIHHPTLARLGLDKYVEKLFKGIGMSGFFSNVSRYLWLFNIGIYIKF